MPKSTSYDDLEELRRELARRLTGLDEGDSVGLSHELPPDLAPKEVRRGRLWRRHEVRLASPEEYFVRVVGTSGGWLTAHLSGSTYAGGIHRTDANGHRSIQSMGWQVADGETLPDHAAGSYAMDWPAADADGLATGIVEALRVLGARPDVSWTLTRSH